VFPGARTSNDSSVPVLSPLGLALLGCREGDVMEWRTQEELHRLCVDAVIYQPEAEGNFFV
jgi:regulator of nucleoside diphosphate kinase